MSDKDLEIFGAFASVRIRYDGSMLVLSKIVAKALHITGIEVDVDKYPPHNQIGSAEALGWQIWLETDSADSEWFCLSFETELSVEEIIHGRMHDLSAWMARYLKATCKLEVVPADILRHE